MTWRDISADQLHTLKDALIVDVRSPCEHTIENIPDAFNVPLLTDDERAVVGTIYATEGEVAARRHALTLISPKIPSLVEQIVTLKKPGQVLVIHCWRGGLRSEAVASFLSIVGIDCWRLTGGYKAWRRMVIQEFAANRYQFQAIVIDGLTGVGKTEILQELAKSGEAVLDLEALANHRGSVFGGVGLGDQPTQKNFEAALWVEIKKYGAHPVFMEAESRKVGKIRLPDFLWNRIVAGKKILVSGTLDARASRIVGEYLGRFDDATISEAVEKLDFLRERLGAKRVSELKQMVADKQIQEAVKALLIEYYDPLYIHQIERNSPHFLSVDGDDPQTAARQIRDMAINLSII